MQIVNRYKQCDKNIFPAFTLYRRRSSSDVWPLGILNTSDDTIQSFSKLLGYTINRNKSQAMPLSRFYLSFKVDKFKCVCKGMQG